MSESNVSGQDGHESLQYDVLVIGAGGAGLRAAIEIKGSDVSVAVVSKSLLGKAHTVMAEGGMAAALGNVDPRDSWEVHFRDTMKSGAYINDWRMVETFVKSMPERIHELERWGALFDRTPEGKVMQRAFGGHSHKRVCHIGDRTGLEVLRTLQDRAVAVGVDVINDVMITRLLRDGDRIAGAFGYRNDTGMFVLFRAKAVILATGGYGRLYKVTSNSWESTGDGIAMAYHAGAHLRDMEMVQFHPTGMAYPESARGLLVTEGVRGEGGLLLNTKGERFMKNYDPERMELSTRDRTARAIYAEVRAGRGTEHEAVYLDISHKDADFIRRKLPSMYHQWLDFAGVDITKEKMEVAPTAHYAMGGVCVDAETCETVVKGLYAAGECSGGLHGANRMGGNSLAEIVAFGKIAGEAAARRAASERTFPEIDQNEVEAEKRRLLEPFTRGSSGENPFKLHDELKETMQTHVGLLRDQMGLKKALGKVLELSERAKRLGVSGSRVFNPGWNMAASILNMLTLAEAIIRSAIERKESRGAHTRTDFPEVDPDLARVNIIVRDENGSMKVERRKVPDPPPELEGLLPEGWRQ